MSHPECEVFKCPTPAEVEIYPRRHDPALAIRLCMDHRELAYNLKHPKQELYSAAQELVRSSLVK